MTILKKTTHRRAGLAVLIPAVILVAAMVPALAAVYPEDPAPRPASSELKQIMAEIEAAEERMEPHLKRIEDIEIDMEPYLAQLEDIEIEIDESRIAEIEAQMQPYIERIQEIEIDMEPYQEKMAEIEAQMHDLELHIDDGTLDEIHRQINEQIEAHMEQFEEIHVEMEPFLDQIEAIHVEMENFHQEMAKVHVDMEPIHAQIEQIHVNMEPFHEQMKEFERAMEPFHEEMEILGDRLEKALAVEVVAVLRNDLGAVVEPGAPLEEAAARITDDAHIHTERDQLRFEGDRAEAREILTDLLSPHRIGTQEAFDAAIDNAARNLSPLVIQID